MKKNIVCISSIQKKIVKKTLISESKNKNTPLIFLNKKNISSTKINLQGNKQNENANLALFTLRYLKNYKIPSKAIKMGLQNIIWHGRNQIINKNPFIIFDVAHNKEGFIAFIKYYKTLKIQGKSTLVIALYSRKKINTIINKIENTFDKVICTQTEGKSPMNAKKLSKYFSKNCSIKIINNSTEAIKAGISQLSYNDSMAILGTHCFGPAINKIFKISFDNI